MRYVLAVVVLIAVFAGAQIFVPREFHHPAPRDGYPPAPTALEESGMPEIHAVHMRPTSPPTHRGMQPPDPAAMRIRSPRPGRLAPPAPAPQAETGPVASPFAQIRDSGVGPGTRSHRIRDPEAGAEPAPSGAPQVGGGPVAQTATEGEVGVRAPVVVPPVLQTPAAGYPAEGYRIVVDRAMLTPRLRIEAAQGRMVLRIRVRPDGSVGEVEVAASSGVPVLDRAAVRAAGGWTFTPATRDGAPIEALVVIPVRFVVP